jgi:hypothetical protein
VLRSRGHVVDEAGHPFSGIYVTAVATITGLFDEGVTDQNGDYDLPCVPHPLLLSIGPKAQVSTTDLGPNLAYGFVGGGASYGSAGTFCSTPQDEPIVTTMHPGATVTGHVTHADGTPATGVWVDVFDPQLGFGPPGLLFSGDEYTVIGLPTGDMTIWFNIAVKGSVHTISGSTSVLDITLPDEPPTSTSTTTSTTTTTTAP